jgi:uncharacterized protein (TIGR04255 family)
MADVESKPFNLKTSPIVEAILDIDCEFPPGLSLPELEASAQESLRATYPQLQKRVLQQVQIRQQGGGPPEHEVLLGGLDRLLFRSEDGKQLTQFRRGGYSFNRLAPYEGMDAYLGEIQRTWENYCGITQPLRIRKIGLRMINRISLPANAEGGINLHDYLKVGPCLPSIESRDLTFTGFLNQHSLVDKITGHQANLSLATEGGANGNLIVLLDIDVFEFRPLESLDWTKIAPIIHSLRNLKNDLFRNTITKKCLSLFTCQS